MLSEDRKLALGIVAMQAAMIGGFVLCGWGLFTWLVLEDATDYGVDTIWYRLLGTGIALIGAFAGAIVVGLVLGQGFWHSCSTDGPEMGRES